MNIRSIMEGLRVDVRKQMMESLYAEDLPKLQEMASKMRSRHFGKTVRFYTQPYVPVSVTGNKCDLSCKHCNGHYLEHMRQVDKKAQLVRLMESLKKSGANGVVLSGGSRKDGSVPTYEFADAVKKAKKKTGMKINAHTGLVTEKQAAELSKFLDAALTDVIGDEITIKEVLGLKYGPASYEKTLGRLRKAGIGNLSPHIIVGLYYGKIRGELNALSMIKDTDPDNIVIVVFIPTKGTEMEDVKPPKIKDVAKIIAIARIMYPDKNISLSCVRPGGRYRNELDREAIKSGINKIAVPSRSAYKACEEMGLRVEEITESRCCCW